MILGALVGAGADARQLTRQLSLLGVSGYEVDFSTVDRSGISATRAHVRTAQEHTHRHLSSILKIIGDSQLGEGVKRRASEIFQRLGEAEARVHNIPVERVHFHEVGALDAIIDVVGACICFELMGVERFISSPLHVGSGMVEMEHGRFPVPPPAVAELLKNVPVYSSDIPGELVTPTGAAIIAAVCEEFGPLPLMKIERTGYGAGAREYQNFPNALRVLIGDDEQRTGLIDERLYIVETNVDDMSPQVLGYLMDKAFAGGALDCYFTAVQMKKNRPGTLVSILCRPSDLDSMRELLLTETTTLGVRSYQVERRSLERESVKVETPYGAIDVKVARINGRILKAMPEYEQCRAAAENHQVALLKVVKAAQDSFDRMNETSPQ